MKRFIISSLIFGLVLSILTIGLYIIIPAHKKHYMYEIKHKIRLTDSVPSPRIIFVGGSNVAFGVDSKSIADSLHINAVNTAIHAGLGLKYQIEIIEDNFRKDDIIVIMPEYQQFKEIYNGEDVNVATTFKYSDFSNLSKFNSAQLAELIKGMIPAFYIDFLKRNDKIYSAENFNENGDEINHRTLESPKPNFDNFSGKFNKKNVESFAEKVDYLKSKGCKVIILPPLTIESYYNTYSDEINLITSSLSEACVPFEVDTRSHVVPDSCAFDTNYHLNDSGIKRITPKLVNELRHILKAQ